MNLETIYTIKTKWTEGAIGVRDDHNDFTDLNNAITLAIKKAIEPYEYTFGPLIEEITIKAGQ